MRLLSSTDLSIALALRDDTLAVTIHVSRFGDEYLTLSDNRGLIEVALSPEEAEERLSDIATRAGL